MKRLLYFLISRKYDIALVLVPPFVSFFLVVYPPNLTVLLISMILLSGALLLIVHLRSKEKGLYFIPLTSRKDKDDWIGGGRFDYDRMQHCYVLTDSDPGYIYSKCLTWSDYEFSFRFKIISECLGIIVRAVNLSNYVMLQIIPEGIRPHIRVNGVWHIQEHKAASLSFTETLSLDRWYQCCVSCEKGEIRIRLSEGTKRLFDRVWSTPRGSLLFPVKMSEEDSQKTEIPFTINLECGSAGFRNWGNEKALIREVLIKKI